MDSASMNVIKENETVVSKNKFAKRNIILIGVAVVLLIFIAIIVASSQSTSKRLAKQLDLGQKYLEEMDYEQAIVAFNKAIEIDPMSVEAYLGMVEVYIRTTDFETALEYARKGYEATGDERLKEKIDMIESGNIFAENGWRMKTSYYKNENELNYYVTYTYNLKGNVESVSAYTPTDILIDKVDYEYNEDGKMTWGVNGYDSEIYGDSSPLHHAEYEYNDIGQTISRKEYDNKGNLTSWSEYEYREDGSGITTEHLANGDYREEEYDGKGYSIDRYYDENGNLISYSEYENYENGMGHVQRNYSADGTLESYVEYENDENGKTIKSTVYDANGEVMYTTVNE